MTASIIRDIEISDILTLKQIKADYVEVKRIVGGKTILINGSGGVLGIELCRRLIKIGCEKLIVVERYESYLNELVSDLLSDNLSTCIVPILLEPGSSNMLDEVFSEHRPNIVIQAGLRKFAPLFGFNMNNVEEINYSRNFYLAELAAKYGCKIFIMISSIFAKDQSNLIEKSLRFAEVSLEKFFKDTGTRLIIVPICDIAESRGGILSIIEAQVKQRKTINLPVKYNRTMIISKNSAAELILQYLVETKEDLLEGRYFSATDSPIVMFDIIQKVTALYNLKVSTENQFIGRGF
jgi:FlaA1/EpsC-like NDP-sugar epimerase